MPSEPSALKIKLLNSTQTFPKTLLEQSAKVNVFFVMENKI